MTSPAADSAPSPVPDEVFVDDSGRRRRIVIRVGYLLGAGCLLYVVLLGVSFAGGPIGPHTLLPVPGLPEKVDDPLGISGLVGVGAPTGDSATGQPDGTRGTGTATPRATATGKATAAAHRTATESLVKLAPPKPTGAGAPAGSGSSGEGAGATPTPTPEAGTTTPPANPTPPPVDPPASPTDSPSTESAPTDPPPTGGTGGAA